MRTLRSRYPTGNHPRRINYYASADIKDTDGHSTGDANADNARVLNQRRFLHMAVGDESVGCTDRESNTKGKGTFGVICTVVSLKCCFTFQNPSAQLSPANHAYSHSHTKYKTRILQFCGS